VTFKPKQRLITVGSWAHSPCLSSVALQPGAVRSA